VSRWRVARISEIEPRDRWIPIRDHLGVSAFGINAWIEPDRGKAVISEHSEEPTGHEELYLVLEGHAVFTVDGEEVDAPPGTLVFVPDPESKRGAVAKELGTVVLALGGKPGEAYSVQRWEQGWEYNTPAMEHYRAGRYAEAADVLRKGLAEHPELVGLHYNLACFAALAGETDEAFEHLARAIDDSPSIRDFARGDSDFDPVRDDARFAELVGYK